MSKQPGDFVESAARQAEREAHTLVGSGLLSQSVLDEIGHGPEREWVAERLRAFAEYLRDEWVQVQMVGEPEAPRWSEGRVIRLKTAYTYKSAAGAGR